MKTKEKILLAAIETFFQFGYHGTRTLTIAEKAMVNKAEVFYYFRNKAGLYREVLSAIITNSDNSLLNISDFYEKREMFITVEIMTNKPLLIRNSILLNEILCSELEFKYLKMDILRLIDFLKK